MYDLNEDSSEEKGLVDDDFELYLHMKHKPNSIIIAMPTNV